MRLSVDRKSPDPDQLKSSRQFEDDEDCLLRLHTDGKLAREGELRKSPKAKGRIMG